MSILGTLGPFIAVFGFLGVTFSKEGAAPGAGGIDQPVAPTYVPTYYILGF